MEIIEFIDFATNQGIELKKRWMREGFACSALPHCYMTTGISIRAAPESPGSSDRSGPLGRSELRKGGGAARARLPR